MRRTSPIVTVVIPMLDEAGAIESCLAGFGGQTYPHEYLDVLVVDGGSTDGSRETVEALAVEHPWIRVIDNPARRASAAFNRGVASAKGDVVCLFSAHGVPDSAYVEASVDALDRTGAAGVGGRYDHVGTDAVSTAIGRAMVSPFGMASPHRFATEPREVDTISHPAYRASALADVGPFDESLGRNSDYELNHRLRVAGHRLVFDPSIASVYRPRPDLTALARQFWHYGRWKPRVVRGHPAALRLRHLVAPAAVIGLVLSPLLIRARWGRNLLKLAGFGYVGVVGAGVIRADPRAHGADPITLAAAFPVMHASWGAGFLVTIAEDGLGG